MIYKSLNQCVNDLEKHGHLIRVSEEIDPNLEIAAIQRQLYARKKPAVLFENIKGCKYKALANLFGTMERCEFIYRSSLKPAKSMIEFKANPPSVLKQPKKLFSIALNAKNTLAKKSNLSEENFKQLFDEIKISDLPQIKSWPDDGGAFITLPQVYSESMVSPGINKANIGMYRVQLNGNNYKQNSEIGLHYQIHRGIGIHHSEAIKQNKKLKVSIFIGGPPAHTMAAVMPMPEGLSEIIFAGMLAKRRFRYTIKDGYTISLDADFCITGEIPTTELRSEGPFGDHLGYYSLKHDFPFLEVHKVYAKKDAIWPFTVVGRPPQEDTSFGNLIHQITAPMVPVSIPGVKAMHAVDVAGVHPLLLAIGSERYTPYNSSENKRPKELLTISNAILGFSQASLAKYLLITTDDHIQEKKTDKYKLDKKLIDSNIQNYFSYVLARIDFRYDLHFHTNTTIDTLDYSGDAINRGSKVVLAAYGTEKRELEEQKLPDINSMPKITKAKFISAGILAIQTTAHTSAQDAQELFKEFDNYSFSQGIMLLVCVDDVDFCAENFENFLWVCFTRSNPASDIYGVNATTIDKHWGCSGALIIDARIKQKHAPELVEDSKILKQLEKYAWLK